MVLLVTTPPILSAFEAVSSQNRKELDLPESLSLAAPISHDQLIRLARRLRPPSTDESNHGRPGLTSTSLDALLRGTKVYVPPPPPKPEPVCPLPESWHICVSIKRSNTDMIFY